jgi:hypothetical protein
LGTSGIHGCRTNSGEVQAPATGVAQNGTPFPFRERAHSLTHTHNHNCNHHGRGGGTAHLPPTLSHRHHRHRHHRHRHHLQSRSSAPHIHTSTSTRARTHAYIQQKHAQVASGGTTPSTPPPRNPRPPWTPRPAPRATTHHCFHTNNQRWTVYFTHRQPKAAIPPCAGPGPPQGEGHPCNGWGTCPPIASRGARHHQARKQARTCTATSVADTT